MKPVKVIDFYYDPNPSGVKGFYDEDVPGYIYVRESIRGLARDLVIVHETQHARCHEINCDCFDLPADFLREYHAFKAEFDYMCAGRFTRSVWRVYATTVYTNLKRYKKKKVWNGHFKALAKVCRLKLFKEYAERFRSYKQIMKLVSEV